MKPSTSTSAGNTPGPSPLVPPHAPGAGRGRLTTVLARRCVLPAGAAPWPLSRSTSATDRGVEAMRLRWAATAALPPRRSRCRA